MGDFDKERIGTGTAEWADVNENICRGCPNNCLYCYAAANAKRFKQRERSEWHIEEFTKRSTMKSYPANKGVVMFPSAHDITPFNVDEYIRVAKLILSKENKLLIVSKPRLDCIKKVCAGLIHHKKQILFRFTIGTLEPGLSHFWEPGAPLPNERMGALMFAYSAGFKTSVSMEPMLAGASDAVDTVLAVDQYVADTIWIGKMNRMRLRVDMSIPENAEAVQKIERQQSDREIVKLYNYCKGHQKIMWKDSVKEVLVRQKER